jgi:Carbohydrate-binding module 48 (Isoamylase N-terminal domain)
MDADRVRDVVARLREMPPTDNAARERLRTALRREPTASRRLILVSPLRVLLAAAALVLVTSVVWLAVLRRGAPRAVAAAPSFVQFVLVAPAASRVSLAGDFNAWDPDATPMTRGDGGIWSVVLPLERGTFTYSYVIDGSAWTADPSAPASPDDFGRPSSVLYVPAETS